MNEITKRTIEDYKNYLIEEEKCSVTIEKYIHDITAFVNWTEGKEITKALVLEYKNTLVQQYAPASVNSVLSSLNGYFNHIERYDLKVKNLKVQRQIFCQSEKELMVGVRDDVDEDTNKKNKSDFVLWFTKSKFDNQELKWESPWGVGYPGWHIECSSISIKHLGEYMDIHCGGVDNIFPHHTNEIAQSEAYLGHKWCNYWFHVHHLNDKSGKMSKSKGDFLTVSLLEEKKYHPLVYRMFCLQSHYRKPLEFSYEVMDNMENSYLKLRKNIARLTDSEEIEIQKFEEYKGKFLDALKNDLNTSMAITICYEVLKAEMKDATKLALFRSFDEVLSLDLTMGELEEEGAVDQELETLILRKIEERKAAKKEKNFAKADEIRAELLEMGIVLEDTREGVKWKKI